MMNQATYEDDEADVAPTCCWKPANSFSNHQQEQSAKHKQVDPVLTDVLTERFNELSVDEQEKLRNDIRGNADTKQESKTFIEKFLRLLEEEISRAKGTARDAYDLAMSMDKSFVNNREFCLMFLRADEFVIRNACKRVLRHFEAKLELFGEKKLVKHIGYDDLSKQDQAILRSGSHQFMVAKDAKGRKIIFNFPELNQNVSYESFGRARWYQLMVAVEEESTQQQGIVYVAFWNDKSLFLENNAKGIRMLREALPFRLVGNHYCFVRPNVVASQLRMLIDCMGEKIQARVCVHAEESAVSCLYALQGYGIHPETVPYDGRPKTDLFLKNLDQRIAFERRSRMKEDVKKIGAESTDNEKQSSTTGIIQTHRDVLLGRGLKPVGNFALDKLIDHELTSYRDAPSQFHKSCIVLATVRRVQESGGRFLKRDGKSKQWVIASDDAARLSVSNRFRRQAALKTGQTVDSTETSSINLENVRSQRTSLALTTGVQQPTHEGPQTLPSNLTRCEVAFLMHLQSAHNQRVQGTWANVFRR